MNLTTKQYYSRVSGLLNTGLIKRHKGKYSLTLLGKLVYDAQMIIGKALAYYWKLKAIESIEISSNVRLPKEELTQLINVLIDNHFIKYILIKEPLSYPLWGLSTSSTSTAQRSKAYTMNALSHQSGCLCNRCQTAIAEIFQESGDFCLNCWQERTYPNL
jgi:hypothetical protein